MTNGASNGFLNVPANINILATSNQDTFTTGIVLGKRACAGLGEVQHVVRAVRYIHGGDQKAD